MRKTIVYAVIAIALFAMAGALATTLITKSAAQETPSNATSTLDCPAIAQELGTIVAIPNNKTTGICDVVLVRQSPVIMKDNVTENVFTLMNSVIEFQIMPGAVGNATGASNASQTVFAMGDFSLLDTEVNPVLGVITRANWTVLSIHNHEIQEKPKLEFIHWIAMGNLSSIINTAKAAFAMTSIGNTASLPPAQTTLDCQGIAQQFNGTAINGPVCDVIIHRQMSINSTGITSDLAPNLVLNNFSLMSAVFEFLPMDNQTVMVMGDFPLLETEVPAVHRVMNERGATLTGMHPHLLQETSGKLSFNHYILVGSLEDVIAALKQGLAQTTIQ